MYNKITLNTPVCQAGNRFSLNKLLKYPAVLNPNHKNYYRQVYNNRKYVWLTLIKYKIGVIFSNNI